MMKKVVTELKVLNVASIFFNLIRIEIVSCQSYLLPFENNVRNYFFGAYFETSQ